MVDRRLGWKPRAQVSVGRPGVMTMNKLTTTNNGLMELVLGLAMAAGCGTGGGFSQSASVVVRGDTARVFAVGPTLVHVYSQDRGGQIFTRTEVSGTDADCAPAPADGHFAAPLAADQVDEITVAGGQVACIVSNSSRPYELLWHARRAEPKAASIFVAHR
jgi:hypothetical protein